MKQTSFFLNAFLALLFSFGLFTSGYSTEKKFNLTNDQLSFIENKGQLVSDNKNNILFYVEGRNVNCFLKKTGLSYVWTSSKTDSYQMNLEFLNSNPNVKIHSEEMMESVNNYYLAHCPHGILDVKSFHKVVYENIYNKIDLVFYVADGSDQNNSTPIKYDFVVKPGGDPKQIKINYIGNKELKLKRDGSLTAYCPLGELKEGKPYTYQRKNDFEKNEIVSAYKIEDDHFLSFNISDYNKNENLIIDPTVQWSTYCGGAMGESSPKIVTDASGNTYMCGNVALTGAGPSILLAKYNAAGTKLWTTSYASDYTSVENICLDATGSSIYITGWTNNTTLATVGQTTYGGNNWDAYLTKFNSSGAVQWCTFYGGSKNDHGYGVATDKLGNVYLSGDTESLNNIATPGAFKTALTTVGGGSEFLVKFDAAGTRAWGTYFGDGAQAYIATDSYNNVFLTGSVISLTPDVSTMGPAFGGEFDAYLAKFSPTGSRLWGTYYGGTGTEAPSDIAIDASDNIFISGQTSDANGIASAGAAQTVYGGNYDAFIAKFSNAGTKLWSSYYGGSEGENDASIVTFSDGRVALAGTTWSTNNISTNYSNEIKTLQGNADGYVVKFSPAGIREWGTYLGGPSLDACTCLSINPGDDLFAAGYTGSTSGIAINAFQNTLGGNQDLFLRKYLSPTITTTSLIPAAFACNAMRSVAFTTTGTFNTPGNSFTAELSDPTGNFNAPGYPIALAGSGTSSPISVTLPYVIAGTGYKIRVVSSSPGVKGTAIGPYTIAASTLAGATFANPINAGTLTCDVQYTDTKNNSTTNCYGNDYDAVKNSTQVLGQSSDDVYYKFTLAQPQRVSISTCFSSFNTYLHLLNATGVHLASNDNSGPVCANTSMASLAQNLAAGTYYVVVEGSGVSSGNYELDICLSTIVGSTVDNPINVGALTCSAAYTSTVNNSPSNCYGDNYNAQRHASETNGQVSDDIYYMFTINRMENVTISTCGSAIDTYIHLLDYNLNFIASNNDSPVCIATPANKSSINRTLSKGTYFLIVEGNGTAAGSINVQMSVTPGIKFIDPGCAIGLPNSSLLDLGTGPFTFEANVTLKSTTDMSVFLSKRNSPMTSDGFLFGAWSDGKMFLQLAGNDISAPASSPTLYDGKCHHVAATRDASNVVKLYLDGVLISTSTQAAININSGGAATIGFDRLGGGFLNGYIRDVRMWNVARTQALIQANMNTALTAPQTGLVGYWRLLEGTGSAATDYSGNTLTGNLYNVGGTNPGPTYVCAPGCVYLRPATDNETNVVNAIEDNSSEETALSVYPNPFSQTTTVIVKGRTEKAILEIVDVNGAIVYKNENYKMNETITLGENIHSGFYILRVITAEGNKSLKLIKTE